MPKKNIDDLAVKIVEVLAGAVPKEVVVHPFENSSKKYEIEIRGNHFIGVYRSSGKVSQVSRAIEEGREAIKEQGNDHSLLVIVPYMGEVGNEYCEKEEVSWLDLSGNASIIEENVTIYIEGKENKFKRPGRPENLFATKSSRVARFLLMNSGQSFQQSEIADEMNLGKGYVSKIISGLEEQDLVQRDSEGVGAKDPDLLLDAWREEYDFKSNEIVKGTIPAKSGKDVMEQVEGLFRKKDFKHAATGLGAGWCYTKFADFRTATFYVPFQATKTVEAELEFQRGAKGANLWLVNPPDNWVMYGCEKIENFVCVHPVQAYLDLISGHPERSRDIAEELRKKKLNWNND